jgi:ribosomal protein S18 acetylase RimI-like enzyme
MKTPHQGVGCRLCGSNSTLADIDRRRLSKFQSCGLFAKDNTGAKYSRAISASELSEAYRLVYDIFLDMGYILPSQSRMRIRPFETSPNTATFIAKKNGTVIGVFSLIDDSSALGLPSDYSFRSEIDASRDQGKHICEMSNQAISSGFRSSSVSTELMRPLYAHALHIGCTDLICAVTPSSSSVNFFRFIGFTRISEEKNGSKDIYDPVVIMKLSDVQHRWSAGDAKFTHNPMDRFWREFFVASNPYIEDVPKWILENRIFFSDPIELIELFKKCRKLFLECDSKTLETIRRHLGSSFYYAYEAAPGVS